MATSRRPAALQAKQDTSVLWVVGTSAWMEWLVDGPLRSQLIPLMPPHGDASVHSIPKTIPRSQRRATAQPLAHGDRGLEAAGGIVGKACI